MGYRTVYRQCGCMAGNVSCMTCGGNGRIRVGVGAGEEQHCFTCQGRGMVRCPRGCMMGQFIEQEWDPNW
jgi:hypothetical protein